MSISFDHSKNLHSLTGPSLALQLIFKNQFPGSMLDVGCGTGTWLSAAAHQGCSDFLGLDGVDIPLEQLLYPQEKFRQQDLTKSWDLGRRFDVALCLEVAEHLEEIHADVLLDSLVRHANEIIFSAACPGQPGQHHVNCQWPVYWQEKFNQRGYTCADQVRWEIWNASGIEPWYRQNMFIARRAPEMAGQERRLPSVLHPDMLIYFRGALKEEFFTAHLNHIMRGRMPLHWYLTLPGQIVWGKIRRRFKRT